MYGMIHKAIKYMVMTKYGKDAWNSIIVQTGFDESYFLAMNEYTDDVTLKLINVTANILELDVNECLFEFGKSWVEQSTIQNYKAIFKVYGPNLSAMLENLNAMHDSITSTFPNYKPPSFTITLIKENKYNILYESQRVGLEAFVLGLIEGLAEYYETKINIEQLSNTTDKIGQHTIFELNIIEPLS